MELLMFSARISTDGYRESIIDQTLHFVGLTDDKKRLIKHFSEGMKKRLSIAQAITHSPDLLILDDPFAKVGTLEREKIVDIIFRYGQRGKAVVFATRYPEDINFISTHIAILKGGELVTFKSLSDIRKKLKYKVKTQLKGNILSFRARSISELWKLFADLKMKGMIILSVEGEIIQELPDYYEI